MLRRDDEEYILFFDFIIAPPQRLPDTRCNGSTTCSQMRPKTTLGSGVIGKLNEACMEGGTVGKAVKKATVKKRMAGLTCSQCEAYTQCVPGCLPRYRDVANGLYRYVVRQCGACELLEYLRQFKFRHEAAYAATFDTCVSEAEYEAAFPSYAPLTMVPPLVGEYTLRVSQGADRYWV